MAQETTGGRPDRAPSPRGLAAPSQDWGEFRRRESAPVSGTKWSDIGKSRDRRQLKHGAKGDMRVVPIPQPLTVLLNNHLDEFGNAPDGRLFRALRGGLLGDKLYSDIWRAARLAGLTPEEAASPLARRPYDLRHAAVSTWLNAGVDPTQVAACGRPQRASALAGLRQGHHRTGRDRQAQDRGCARPHTHYSSPNVTAARTPAPPHGHLCRKLVRVLSVASRIATVRTGYRRTRAGRAQRAVTAPEPLAISDRENARGSIIRDFPDDQRCAANGSNRKRASGASRAARLPGGARGIGRAARFPW